VTKLWANLATLANALCGVGAIAYLLAGNKLWGGLLIVSGVGFDGLDGFLSRRAGGPPGRFGRVADSVADAITFGAAPAALIIVHTDDPGRWAAYENAAMAVGALLVVLALARLTYFTVRGYQRRDFLGVPTPQTALAVLGLSLWFDLPGFAGIQPGVLVAGAAIASVAMIVPVPFPKLRKGSKLRWPMAVTAMALVLAELPLQFRPDAGTLPYELAWVATTIASVGLLLYYLVGPFTVVPEPPREVPNAG
jgi:phosphatidylserine synthase